MKKLLIIIFISLFSFSCSLEYKADIDYQNNALIITPDINYSREIYLSVYDSTNSFIKRYILKKRIPSSKNIIYFNKKINDQYKIYDIYDNTYDLISLGPNNIYFLQSLNSHTTMRLKFKTDYSCQIVK